MENLVLWNAGIRRHKGSIVGIFLLIFLVALSLSSVFAVSSNSSRYVRQEMERLSYGDITAWVSNLSDPRLLVQDITAIDEIESVGVQDILYSEYEVGNQESDSEGQLIVYEPEEYGYKLFQDDLSGYKDEPVELRTGQILVPASMKSMFDLDVGDSIAFPIARSGVDSVFIVAGYFEDPFMGSSMIGMKSFLICCEDYDKIAHLIAEAGVDSLARQGYMLHIEQNGALPASELNRLLNEDTSLTQLVEFTHSAEVLAGFMLTLQNVFTGLLMAFVLVLLVISLVVLSHSIGTGIEQDTVNMGILKTLGFTTGRLRGVQLLQYMTGIFPGLALGVLAAVPASAFLCRMTFTTTGLLVPSALPAGICAAALSGLMLMLMAFVWLRCGRIGGLTPVCIMQGRQTVNAKTARTPIRANPLGIWLALRQLSTGKRRYVGVFVIAILLTFFASMTGRIDSWLGPNGEGLMDAFNPADLHIAAQPMGETTLEQVEGTISACSEIVDQYALAMPSVSVNGVDYTANVITEPERFHMLRGNTCARPDQIVLTEFVAADMGVSIGDTVTVTGALGSGTYTVSGIYQCANDMGANIGMSREGYRQIGEDTPQIWCEHYFIADPALQPEIVEALDNAYGGDVYIHENSWPGLYGILSAMDLLMIFEYIMVGVFILIVTLLASGKLLLSERRDLSIYRALGVSSATLRRSFAMRFLLVSLLGCVVGVLLGAVGTDPIVSVLMRMYGISNFHSDPGVGSVVLPGVVIVLMFTVFAYFASAKIKRARLTELMQEM